MQLLFDIGNSRIKPAILNGDKISLLKSVATLTHSLPTDWNKHGRPSAVHLASVANREAVARVAAWVELTWDLKVNEIEVLQGTAGLTTKYLKPKQLGVDRWLASLAAYHMHKTAVCVIDAGTALTVDIVDRAGVHHGGMIAPGLDLMITSLTQETAQLALRDLVIPTEFGLNTETAISLGCTEYIAGMLDRIESRLRKLHIERCDWIVTGGQADIVTRLASRPLEIIPELVFRGIAIVAEETA